MFVPHGRTTLGSSSSRTDPESSPILSEEECWLTLGTRLANAPDDAWSLLVSEGSGVWPWRTPINTAVLKPLGKRSLSRIMTCRRLHLVSGNPGDEKEKRLWHIG